MKQYTYYSGDTDLSEDKRFHVEKQILDNRFDFMTKRVKSFSSTWGDFGSKHIRFDSTDDEPDYDDSSDDGGDNATHCQHPSTFSNKERDKRVSSCPYPSTTEEMVRLGLKAEANKKAAPANRKLMGSSIKTSSGKRRKRKSEEEKDNSGGLCKVAKKEQVELDDQGKLYGFTITKDKMETFVATWKEACREHSVAKVCITSF